MRLESQWGDWETGPSRDHSPVALGFWPWGQRRSGWLLQGCGWPAIPRGFRNLWVKGILRGSYSSNMPGGEVTSSPWGPVQVQQGKGQPAAEVCFTRVVTLKVVFPPHACVHMCVHSCTCETLITPTLPCPSPSPAGQLLFWVSERDKNEWNQCNERHLVKQSQLPEEQSRAVPGRIKGNLGDCEQRVAGAAGAGAGSWGASLSCQLRAETGAGRLLS